MVHKGYTRLLAMALAVLIIPAIAGTAEIDLGTAYTPEELAKVREWEKSWAGKKIDKSNIDQIAEFYPAAYVQIYKEPEKWGAPPEGLWFAIDPYQQIKETKGMIEATQKYAPTIKKPDASDILEGAAALAGRPYPKPESGIEVAYNIDFNNHGDTCKYRRYSPNINPKNRTDRLSDQEYTEFYWVQRTEIEPKPALPDNDKGYRRGFFTHMYLPAEFLNTRMFCVRYIDPKKEDDTYLWYSQFRRIRRLSTSQRTDSIDGTDLIYDDEYMWDGQITRNTYKYLGKKDLLCSRHTDLKKSKRIPGQAIANGLSFERCNTLMVEAVNKDTNYIYSKRVWYVDPETYLILWQEIYDENGKFWKNFCNYTCPLPTKQGDMKPFIVGTCFPDIVRVHSGMSHQQYNYEPIISDPTLKSDIFTINNLQKTY